MIDIQPPPSPVNFPHFTIVLPNNEAYYCVALSKSIFYGRQNEHFGLKSQKNAFIKNLTNEKQ